MKHLRAAAAAFTLFAGAAVMWPVSHLAQAGREDGLKETLGRLEKTLTRHGSRSVGGVIRRFDARDFRGCRITYELTPVVAPDHEGFVPFTERTTVDLSALDPARVSVRGGQKGAASVVFNTLSGGPGIEHRVGSGPHHFGDASLFRVHHLSLTNKGAAEEVRATLLRAIELCRP